MPIIGACIVAGGGVAFAATYKGPAPKAPAHLVVDTSSSSLPLQTDDTWRRTLANLSSTTLPYVTGSSSSEDSGPLTLTQQVSENLLMSYMSAKKSDQPLTSDQETQLASDALTNAVQQGLNLNQKVYVNANLKTAGSDSSAVIRTYGEQLVSAITSNTPKGNDGQNELTIINNILNNNAVSDVSKLSSIVTSYQDTLAALLKIRVPTSAASIHLNLINDFSLLIPIDQKLTEYKTDPVGTILAVQKYQDAANQLALDFKAFALYMDSKGISYPAGDPAQKFIQSVDDLNI